MQLKDYFQNISKKNGGIFFSGIGFQSTKIKRNYIFFAIKGNQYDGNDFIENAIKKGAKVIISEKKQKKRNGVLFLHSNNVRKLLAEVSYKIFSRKPKKLIAVTGTNGKSSVADFYYQILNLNSKKVASIGTLGVKANDKKKIVTNTTLDPIQLGLILENLKKNKINFVIMEASSHGLEQNRLDGLSFDIGIFTNLSHDHIDYHKNMNNYLSSKLYLFDKLIKKKGEIISDAKIHQLKRIKKISDKRKINLNLIFDKKKGIELISHKFENEKQILLIRYNNKNYNISLNLIGKIQIKNILMALLATNKSGLKIEKIISTLHKIKPVEGRLEKIGNIKNKSKIILDYAHTPDALKLALTNLREQFPSSKITLVFGCGGNRDNKKRPLMGRIASKYADIIYLTDDNPRNENPSYIRQGIKRGIKRAKIFEIPSRKIAIQDAVASLKTGDILLVAGKGHEKIQDYGEKKLFFSDRHVILKSVKKKNKLLSKNLKLNIIKEQSQSEILQNLKIRNISIDSKTINKNDIFFAIKGKKNDGNKFAVEAIKKKSSLVVLNHINKKVPSLRQIKVKNTLSFLTKCSSIFRNNINTKIVSITGSCGKTTLKEMIAFVLKKVSKTSSSPKSFNNNYGVPLSLFNLNESDDFGVLEVGMDKKGEIDYLTNIIKPNLGIITNISYAHSKNFKNINHIAYAKAEIMNNIKKGGTIVLNKDDQFYNFHKKYALERKLNIISFGINNKTSSVNLIKISKIKNQFKLFVDINGLRKIFYSSNDYKSNIYNILATIACIDNYIDIKNLKKDTFLNFMVPNGRGDISKVFVKNKKITLIDETYNSNPLSLKTAIENYDKLKTKNSKKYLILGDMLELGKHSLRQHKLISGIINKTKINCVYVIGRHIKETFKGLKKDKKGQIFTSEANIINLIKDNLNNNDYLMIKGSNSTGLHKITKKLKEGNTYAI